VTYRMRCHHCHSFAAKMVATADPTELTAPWTELAISSRVFHWANASLAMQPCEKSDCSCDGRDRTWTMPIRKCHIGDGCSDQYCCCWRTAAEATAQIRDGSHSYTLNQESEMDACPSSIEIAVCLRRFECRIRRSIPCRTPAGQCVGCSPVARRRCRGTAARRAGGPSLG